jgi:hypothetical protein
MRRLALSLVICVVIAACGGDGDSPPDTGADSTTTSTFVASCPSGILGMQGDGPDYIAVRSAYERAQAGDVPDGKPAYLGSATGGIPSDLMVGLEYTGCSMLDGSTPYEQMSWGNGIGLLLVSWHEWPRTDDPSGAPFGGTATQRGVVQVSRIEQGDETTRVRVVHLFDGLKVVTAYTFALTTMSIDQVEEVAWAVYDGLPLDMRGAESSGATIDQALAALRSDAVTVSEPEPSAEMSVFTAVLGAGHMSYSAVVDGSGVMLYDFGTPEVAGRMAESISLDGSSVAGIPYLWTGDPHFWLLGRVILLYQGSRDDILELMTRDLGVPVAGAVAGS